MTVQDISSKAEDYLRALHEIVARKGFARIKDIARELGVKPPTVVEMMRKLDAKGLVSYEKYGGVTLTDRGRDLAEVVRTRHETFKRFLEILLVPEVIASHDAHILEHALRPETIRQFSRFVDFTADPKRPKFIEELLEEFGKYCEAKEAGRT